MSFRIWHRKLGSPILVTPMLSGRACHSCTTLSVGRQLGRRDHVNQADHSVPRTAVLTPDDPRSALHLCDEQCPSADSLVSVAVFMNAPNPGDLLETEHNKRAVGEHSNAQSAAYGAACFPRPTSMPNDGRWIGLARTRSRFSTSPPTQPFASSRTRTTPCFVEQGLVLLIEPIGDRTGDQMGLHGLDTS
jgi:hypothetical protein